MNHLKRRSNRRSSSPPLLSLSSILANNRSNAYSHNVVVTANSAIPYEFIIPYINDINDLINLQMVSKSAKRGFTLVSSNPYCCSINDTIEKKKQVLTKEFMLFPNMEVLRCDMEVLKTIDQESIQLYTIDLIDKLIQSPVTLIQKLQPYISCLRLFLEESTPYNFDSMQYLRTLWVDLNNNTESMAFMRFMKSTLASVQQLPYFTTFTIECCGDDLFRLKDVLEKATTTKFRLRLNIHNIGESHISTIQPLLRKRNIYFFVYENELCNSIESYPFFLQYIGDHRISLTDGFLLTPSLMTVCDRYCIPRLEISGFNVGLSTPFTTLDLSAQTSLVEFKLVRVNFSQQFEFTFPASLTKLEIISSFNFSLPNLASLPLYEFSVSGCSIKEFYIPPSAKVVRISHCNAVSTIPNLSDVSLETLVCTECKKLLTIRSSTSLKHLSLYWCSNLRLLELGDGLQSLDVFANKGLTSISLPTTLTSLELNYCDRLTRIDNFNHLTIPVAPDLRYKYTKHAQ